MHDPMNLSYNLQEQHSGLNQHDSPSRSEIQPRAFENSFWGKDDRGVEALMNKMRKAKQTCADLKSILSARSSVEEEYGKKLLKIAKTDICKDETGEMQKALSRLRCEFEATGNAHIETSQRIKLEVENSLGSFISNQRERRKAQAAIIEKILKKQIAEACQSPKKKYLTEKSKISGFENSVSNNGSKDFEKAQVRQYKMKELEQEYTRLSGELEEATRIWQHDWRVSCRLFQELEEERIEFIKKICWDFSNIIASVCLKDDESCERIRTALQNITVEHEIQSFIDERGTGYDPDYENGWFAYLRNSCTR
ncbi:formin-binding protein [Entomophthora muscae]|uniref:Formin-binding protein n=1 Tax=Entomophthora muscae TaxID=34485 RepID=A0ACC2RRY1_9FUNG|nr:formin-binding protein [Entomophthora muscae]